MTHVYRQPVAGDLLTVVVKREMAEIEMTEIERVGIKQTLKFLVLNNRE